MIAARNNDGYTLGYGLVEAEYYPSPTFSGIGGDITESGGYRIHTFLTSGTFETTTTGTVDVLVVAGGGAARDLDAGGGGGGGFIYESNFIVSQDLFTVTVGDGGVGAGDDTHTKGDNSVFSTITAYGGGIGGNTSRTALKDGGSGGGAGYSDSKGNGVVGQGYDGGAGYIGGAGGGGGGSSTVGGDGSSGGAGAGGTGTSSDISGSTVWYAGGGGGGAEIGSAGAGGTGGGGDGSYTNGQDGTPNTGGGGGGGGWGAYTGGDGGSGIVIIRYPIT